MTGYIQHKEFKNAIDVKSLALQITHEYYPQATEKLMETRREYLQGCRESDIRTLLQQETISDLVDRFFEYASPNTVQELKDFIIDKCVEFNFVDDEELR